MKKFLGILVLGLLWCNIGVAACIEGNCIDGKGTYMWTSGKLTGDKYLGQFKDGKMHGQGTYTYLNGDRYIGYFKNGVYIESNTDIHLMMSFVRAVALCRSSDDTFFRLKIES